MSRINTLLWLLIVGLRPLFGNIQCRYFFTCTQFAQYQLQHHSFFVAVWAIIKRFFSCNPFIRCLTCLYFC